MKVELVDDWILFHVSFIDNWKAKQCGARFHPPTKKWRCRPTKLAAAAIKNVFLEDDIDPAIALLLGPSVQIPELARTPQEMIDDITLTEHQNRAVNKAWPHNGFAFFHVMGNGKTASSIALANLRRAHGLIDQVLVVPPTSVKGVWSQEYDKYSAMEQEVFILDAGGKIPTKFDKFPVVVVGIESFSQGTGYDKAHEFASRKRTMVIIDESSSIKNHSSGRTKRAWELGQRADFRLILTGTNVTQGIQDLYAQMYFLDPCVIGELSFYSFRSKYVVMGGFEQRKVIGYRNVEQLFDKIRPYCDVVRKKDMKGLPPKNYQIRQIKASAEQVRACKEIAKNMKTVLGDREISVKNTLEALLRFQQIAGGFDPNGAPLSSNPKMTELMNLLEEVEGKVIIWARYLPEIKAISEALEKRWPGSVLTLTGAVPSEERQSMVNDFQTNEQKRFFVANQATGAKGLTLTAATVAIYYSNTFSHEDRSQSEDRCHRMGSTLPVTYIELVTDLKVDRLVTSALARKKDVADYVGDTLHTRIDDLL